MSDLLFAIKFAIAAFAVWRLSSLLARESGPYKIFDRLRVLLYVTSIRFRFLQTWSDGIVCMWCNSMWVSAIVSLTLSYGIIEWAIMTLALSACAIFLENKYGNSENQNAP